MTYTTNDYAPYGLRFIDLLQSYALSQAEMLFATILLALRDDDKGRNDNAIGFCAYQFIKKREAWKMFCQKYNFPIQNWKKLSGEYSAFGMLEESGVIESMAMSDEEALRFVKTKTNDTYSDERILPTIEDLSDQFERRFLNM